MTGATVVTMDLGAGTGDTVNQDHLSIIIKKQAISGAPE